MSVDENKVIAYVYINEMQNKQNLEIADELCTEACLFHLGQNTFSRGEYKELIRKYSSAFAEHNTTIHDQIAEDDRVATRWTARFTHSGTFMGIPPTNKEVSVNGISIYRFAEGKIVEVWINWDRLGLLQQLGVIPSLPVSARD